MPVQLDVLRVLSVQLDAVKSISTKKRWNNMDFDIHHYIFMFEINKKIEKIIGIFLKLEKWWNNMIYNLGDISKILDQALEFDNDGNDYIDGYEFWNKVRLVDAATSNYINLLTQDDSPLQLKKLDLYDEKLNPPPLRTYSDYINRPRPSAYSVQRLNFDFTENLTDTSYFVTETAVKMLLDTNSDFVTENRVKDLIENLSPPLKQILAFLTIFPEGSLIKKRTIYYWWIGEQQNEDMLDKNLIELRRLKFIECTYKEYRPDIIDSCILTSSAREVVHDDLRNFLIDAKERNDQLINWPLMPPTLSQASQSLSFPSSTVCFNMGISYLQIKKNSLEEKKECDVIMLGRLHSSFKNHIEIENSIEFLKWLGCFKRLHYLSLRGISRIIELPPEIGELKRLLVLDLRACYDLKSLPVEIKKLVFLTCLDTSECYFLSHMPKEILFLERLKVLKGFVVGSSSQRQHSCHIDELNCFENLEKLSINFKLDSMVDEGEFNSLSKLTSLVSLTITWAIINEQYFKKADTALFLNENDDSPPSNLEKIDLRGIEKNTLPKWLRPDKLKNLKRLYIRGGKFKLQSLLEGDRITWSTIKVIRLRFVQEIFKDEEEETAFAKAFDDAFPSLEYVESKALCCREQKSHVVVNPLQKQKLCFLSKPHAHK